MKWTKSNRGDPVAVRIADRHYNRQKPGTPQFVPPGSCLVLLHEDHNALWVTSWPKAEYVKHAWAGAWVNSLFRREPECTDLSSDLIVDALAATRWYYGDPPPLGMITFVNASKIRSTHPGYCYKKAGFRHVGFTKGGLHAFQMPPEQFPVARAVKGVTTQENLWPSPE